MSTSKEVDSLTDEWRNRHRQLYTDSTFHPFTQKIRDGNLPLSAFKQWLGQDYIFVREFVRFIASILLKAPKDSEDGDIDVILGGLVALQDELSWFRKEASKWEIKLHGAEFLAPNKTYCSFLESLMRPEVEYGVVMAALWAIEVVYCESFAKCLDEDAKTSVELLEACQRWGNPEFKKYCNILKNLADQALKNASSEVQLKAEATFVEVLKNEIEFWNMSFFSKN